MCLQISVCMFAQIAACPLLFILDLIIPFRCVFSPQREMHDFCRMIICLTHPLLIDSPQKPITGHTKTFLLLNCKFWLCLPWWKALACLCLHSCLRKDFCLCAFRPLYNLLKAKEAGHDGSRPVRCLHFLDCF